MQWIKASERMPEAQQVLPLLIDCGDYKRYDVGSLNPFTGNFNATLGTYPPNRIEWLAESSQASPEIEMKRVMKLLEDVVKQSRNIYPEIKDPNKAWLQFKTDNNL